MNKKQLAGLIIAAVAFVIVSGSSILMNAMTESMSPQTKVLDTLLGGTSVSVPLSPYVGIVTVSGTIQSGASDSLLETVSYDHTFTLDLIDTYEASTSNKGILLYVDSPGGSVYASDELYLRLQEYSENTGRPVWTYMGSMAASGGYYIAMASDEVVANRNTWTGSIGVVMSFLNYKELADELGVKMVYFTSGRNKSMGAATEELTPEQQQIFQSMIDEPYEQFVEIVAEGRGLDIATVKPLADGRIYTAKQALDANLIDAVEPYEDTLNRMEAAIGEYVEFYEPERSTITLSSLFSSINDIKRTDAERMMDLFGGMESGVPMYVYNGQ